jgi:hypothetical protein
MKRSLVSFATGPYTQLLDISRPTFRHYAERHGYEYVEGLPGDIDRSRPPSWWRIPALQKLLAEYDAVLWLGCDVVIVDSSRDIADEIPAGAWQAMTTHNAPEGQIPNCDVWYLTPALFPYMAQAWALTEYTHHPWWEQAAILHLMGHDLSGFPIRVAEPTELYRHTHFLPLEWNSHESRNRHPSPRFAHATHGPFPWRIEVMRRYRAQADCP